MLFNGRGYSLRLQVPSAESREVQMSMGSPPPGLAQSLGQDDDLKDVECMVGHSIGKTYLFM